jgi:hypothetical protein
VNITVITRSGRDNARGAYLRDEEEVAHHGGVLRRHAERCLPLARASLGASRCRCGGLLRRGAGCGGVLLDARGKLAQQIALSQQVALRGAAMKEVGKVQARLESSCVVRTSGTCRSPAR